MEKYINENVVNILLPEDNSSEQHIHEIGLFLYKKEDKIIRNNEKCFRIMGLNFDAISDYDVFLAMWLIFKSMHNYTDSVAFSFNIWDNKMTLINNEIVLN